MKVLSCNESLPPFNQLVLAWLEGSVEHSDMSWRRAGWAFMVRHEAGPNVHDQWALSHYNRAIDSLDASHATVTHWVELPGDPTR